MKRGGAVGVRRAVLVGATPLFIAAQEGHDLVVRTLLDAGADKDLAKNNGCTPLLIAAEKGHDAVVRTLLDAGADKDLAMNDGATPLLVAAWKGHVTVVRALLDAGADNTTTWRGMTALDLAKTTEMKDLLS